MRKVSYIFSITFLTFFFSCSSDNGITSESEFIQQPFRLDMKGVIELYSAVTDTRINSRVMSREVPNFEDMIYKLSILRSNGGAYQTIKEVNFTLDELTNSEVLIFTLEQNLEHVFELDATYMLTSDDVDKASEAGLSFSEIEVTNSLIDDAAVDTTVTTLDYFQNDTNFSFGVHNLSRIFGLSSDFIIPNPEDTLSFYLSNATLIGPRLFDINIENTINDGILGEVTLEFDGGNSEAMEVSLDTIPDELFVAYDWLSKIELFYTSPSSTRTSIMKKESGLGGDALIFYALNVTVPEIVTDAEGEFVSTVTPGTDFWEILFSDDLYRRDTITLGE